MNIPCPNYSPCPDVYPPYTNLSSEDPDRFSCIGRSWGDYQSPPRLGSRWTQSDCYQTCELTLSDTDLVHCRAIGADMCSGECVTSVSQELADICAANQTAMCPDDVPGCPECLPDNPNPPPGRPYILYQSNSYDGHSDCPDGSTFHYFVPRGTFVALSQRKADAMAKSFGDRKARENRICLSGAIPSDWCVSTPFSSILTASAAHPIFLWSSTQLPNFLTLTPNSLLTTATLAGTILNAGKYSFTVDIIDEIGNSTSKSFTLNVLDILPDTPTLPGGSIGTAYSTTVSTYAWATAPISWQVTSGALPPGLTLNEQTGVISGTPTTAGAYNFVITLQTSAT